LISGFQYCTDHASKAKQIEEEKKADNLWAEIQFPQESSSDVEPGTFFP
jgi:hypothetical protein